MTGVREDREKAASFQREALPHLDAVFCFALRLTGAQDQAGDLVQDTVGVENPIRAGSGRQEWPCSSKPHPLCF